VIDPTYLRQRNLERLKRLLNEGALTPEEFRREEAEVFRLTSGRQLQPEGPELSDPDLDEPSIQDRPAFLDAAEVPAEFEYSASSGYSDSKSKIIGIIVIGTLLAVLAGWYFSDKVFPEAEPQPTHFVTAAGLNCREEPTTRSAVVMQYAQDDQIVSSEERNGWIKSQNDCWVSGGYLRESNDAASETGGEAALISEWQSLNGDCRGGRGLKDPATRSACDARETLGAQLNALDLCYGRRGEAEYEMKWHYCGPNSRK